MIKETGESISRLVSKLHHYTLITSLIQSSVLNQGHLKLHY